MGMEEQQLYPMSAIRSILGSSAFARDAATGTCVGFTDIAFVYPLAVIATRRECGISLTKAIGQRNFWAGGWTAGTLLVPYSICVESLSRAMQRFMDRHLGEGSVQGHMAAAAATTLVVTAGLQPIEKKLVMDQMLQERSHGAASSSGAAAIKASGGGGGGGISAALQPVREISAYARAHGIRPLFDGAVPLMLRELCYITSITVVNPLVTRYLDGKGGSSDKGGQSIMTWQQVIASLSVGMAAGMASAPAQTVSAMMKSEENRGKGFKFVWKKITDKGLVGGVHRLWFGAATRSLRTGGACVLYTWYRTFMSQAGGVDDGH